MTMTPTVGIIVIGNELLSGSGVESNGARIAAFFHRYGYRVDEIRLIRDTVSAIAAAVAEFAAAHEYICTSGGIGPTHDDMTLESVAHAFGVPMQHHQPMADYLTEHFPHIDQRVRARLSVLPKGTRIHANNDHWPVIEIRNCFTLPGVPRGMEASLKRMEDIIPRLDPFIGTEFFVNCSENLLLFALEEYAHRFPTVEIGCYPATTKSDWKTKLRLESQQGEQLHRLADELEEYLRRNDWLVSFQIDQ